MATKDYKEVEKLCNSNKREIELLKTINLDKTIDDAIDLELAKDMRCAFLGEILFKSYYACGNAGSCGAKRYFKSDPSVIYCGNMIPLEK